MAPERFRASLAAALGATAGRLQRGIVSHALRLTGLGLVFGVVAAMLAAGWIQEFLPPGQEARDPLAMAGAAVALAMLAGVAAWLPAPRASRVASAQCLVPRAQCLVPRRRSRHGIDDVQSSGPSGAPAASVARP
jgi:hypothetical protein